MVSKQQEHEVLDYDEGKETVHISMAVNQLGQQKEGNNVEVFNFIADELPSFYDQDEGVVHTLLVNKILDQHEGEDDDFVQEVVVQAKQILKSEPIIEENIDDVSSRLDESFIKPKVSPLA